MVDHKLQYYLNDDDHKRLYRFKDYDPQIWRYEYQQWEPYAYLGKVNYDEIWVSPITPEEATKVLEKNNPCTHEEALAILASDVPEHPKEPMLDTLCPWEG